MSPFRTAPHIEALVLRVRQDRQYGVPRLRLFLRRYHAVSLSMPTIRRILREHHVPRVSQKRYRPGPNRRPDLHLPGQSVQVDVEHLKTQSGAIRSLPAHLASTPPEALGSIQIPLTRSATEGVAGIPNLDVVARVGFELLFDAPAVRVQCSRPNGGPYLSHILSPSPGFSDYRYERRADGHWTITTTGRDYCDRPQTIEATSGSSVPPTEFVNCPGQFWWRLLFSAQLGPRKPVSPDAVVLVPFGRSRM